MMEVTGVSKPFMWQGILNPGPGTLDGAGILQELGHIRHQCGRWCKEAREEG